MRMLFSTGSAARYMAPPQLSDQQVNCGPDWLDRDIGGHVTSLSTPTGEFDLSAVAARLPEEQQPDAVVCLVDASWRALPRNLRAFRCPKILLVADTHHLTAPLTGMIRYAKSEPFDRIVFLYDRHHWEFFHAAGLRQLYWFPGLTLPHGDAAIRSARLADDRRIGQLAFVGQTGICHPRRIQMLSNLNAHSVPLAVKAVSQRESVGFYGSSLVGFNASLNGDLNLRVFEIMASGAMLLTDRLAKPSGLEDLWQDGRELLTYGSPGEMVERAQHAIQNPAEARKIGERGAQWIDTHFNENVRRRDFQKLVFEGVAPTHFQLPTSQTFSVGAGQGGGQARLIGGFEYVQELHRNLDRVVVVLDESVPDGFTHMCATLPRVDLRRGPIGKAGRADFMAIGRANFASPSLVMAAHVWAWDGGENDRVALVRRCASMGLMLTDSTQLIFCRNRVNTHTNQGAIALVRMEQGGYDDALKLAQAELAKNPKSVDAHIVIVELAQESGNVAAGQPALAQLRTLAPNHPRLREILSATPELLNHRRANRLVRTGCALFDEKKWVDAETLARAALKSDPKSAEAYFLLGQIGAVGGNGGSSCGHFAQATHLAPEEGRYWFSWGQALRKVAGRELDALAAFVRAADLAPSLIDYQLVLAEVALTTGHGALAVEALEAVEHTWPGHSLAAKWLVRARALVRENAYDQPRDLLLSHVEVTRLQGTGVLLGRFFPNSKNFVTVRSRTLYKGSVDFEGVQFSLDLPGISDEARASVLRRLLAPYRINRILCVPFFASDFVHALTAHELTGAPLCTYVMDDQVLHTRAVPDDLAQKLFAASDLRLAISAEMIAEYSAWFRCSFYLLPPIVTNRDHEMPNSWDAASGSPQHCAMVGNIWSARQFEQVRAFTRAAGLKVDWFGNANVAWLPKDQAAMEKDGIFCRGFLAEDQLAARLSAYPFVLLPSGALDGTEDNEWLTRLSLPSRIVFIVTKTFTPMLVLGHGKTAAARFVQHFGLGTSSNYNSDEAAAKIGWVTETKNRQRLLDNARQLSPSFLMPDCGEWIWRSLAAKRCEPAPFDRLYLNAGHNPIATDDQSTDARSVEAEEPSIDQSQSFSQSLVAIVTKLSDQAFLDSHLPPDEPRQRVGADLRGAVKYLHEALAAFGPLQTRLLAAERLALAVPNNRAVLVAWAELLESNGNLAEAAAKARKALSYFYDDVYTQTLFMRCVGDVNHHADASDRFCSHPFDNFEIYKDGSVFPCNCTQVPFPIGNVYKQSATEIWQSPQAQAIRQSILDGSFRYCSPMTCYKRFDLPKRSEHPEEFARLQKIGITGVRKPKELNLSYDLSCNLSCPSCRNGKVMATAEERLKLDHVRDNIVLPLLADKDAEAVYITGSGDAFGSPHFRGILKQLCDPKYEHVRITLGTNGQLLTPRLWEELGPLHPRFRDITISIDGATPESYERHRRGSTWEKLQLSMGILANARRMGVISRLMVNMVVQQDNFLEMRQLLVMCKAWSVDGVRFYRIRQWGNVEPGTFVASDVANPMHPRHTELLAELAHPIFGEPIVDRYDMYELIERCQASAVRKSVDRDALWTRFKHFAEECVAASAANSVSRSRVTSVPEQVRRLEEFFSDFGSPELQRSAAGLLAVLSGRNQALECATSMLFLREKRFAAAANKARTALELGDDDYAQRLFERCESELVARRSISPTIHAERTVPPGIVSGKTAREPLPAVSRSAAGEQESIARLAKHVCGRTVGFVLHGSSVAEFADHRAELTAADVTWVGLNHFSLLEDRFLRPAGKEFSVVFCCADGEVQRRLPELVQFLRRPNPNLLITRPDHYSAFIEKFRPHRDSIALEQLPPLWPFPNSLTIFLRMLVQAGARRIVLFGCDGYLGDDDLSVPTYFGAEEFIREKRYSGVLLDTLLFNAHMPRVLKRWRERLGSTFPEIVNCSPRTLMRCFPTIDYSQAAAALAGKPLITRQADTPIDLPVPLPSAPHDAAPDLVACLNAGRKGDLALAREHALRALRLAPASLTPFAQRVLQTDPRAIAAAHHFLMLAGGSLPGAEQIRAADLAREMRENWEAIGEMGQNWDSWEEPNLIEVEEPVEKCIS